MEQARVWRCGDCVVATALRILAGQASCARRVATLDSACGLAARSYQASNASLPGEPGRHQTTCART